jgi:protein-S-isoprenylcysteine O-methyltransferase Ste14
MLPPSIFGLHLLAMVGLYFLLSEPQWIVSPWRFVGAIPILVGAALAIHGSRLFERHGTTIKPFQESSKLVVDGAFVFSRNPMYLGMVGILIGSAVLLGSPLPWLVVPVFVAIITRRFILVEEADLERKFGEAFVE